MVHLVCMWCGVVWCGVVWCGVVRCGAVWCGVVWCGVVWCGVVWCGVVWCDASEVWCVVRSLAHAARKAHLDEVQGATALRVLLMVYPFGSSPGSCESPAVGSRHASQLAPAEQPH